MAARSLLVVLYGVVVGRVAQRSSAAEPEFIYEPAYLATRPSTPLGVRMPLSGMTYRGREVRTRSIDRIARHTGQLAERLDDPMGR